MNDQIYHRLRGLIASSAFLALLGGGALAQGVPVVDGQSFAEKLRAFAQLERDEDTQVDKANNRAEIKDFQQQQDH